MYPLYVPAGRENRQNNRYNGLEKRTVKRRSCQIGKNQIGHEIYDDREQRREQRYSVPQKQSQNQRA
jgi:hypothetical protein